MSGPSPSRFAGPSLSRMRERGKKVRVRQSPSPASREREGPIAQQWEGEGPR